MAQSGRADSDPGSSVPTDPVLRAKYLDYCSARVADRLLRLTADEMYVLARAAAEEMEEQGGAPLSYTDIVRLATDRISETLALPDFSQWAEEYRADPERYENELLGLWESDVRSADAEG